MPEQSATAPNRVVVGVDGSAPSKEALHWAARIAAASGATIDAVITWDYPVTSGAGYLPSDWDPSKDAETVLSQAVEDAYGSDRPERLRLIVREGGAARVLLAESEGAEMLVVGSRGLGGFSGLLLGSVSANCAEHAQCPVLVVHGLDKRWRKD
jgi:nucleotide-binding universal stress UspA family protein